jgi:ribose/xylose/arabinose/galactoside ABC-type transport system permease subunit
MAVRRRLADPDVRPYAILVATIAILALIDYGAGKFVSRATAFSVLQLFATLAPVTIGLALTMMIREFDISVAGMFGFAGCIAVLAGAESPVLGVLAAVAVGFAGGLVQGLIMVGLRLSSIGVTLGGLLTFTGLAYVLTENKAINYPDMEVALAVNEPFLGILSPRSAIALAIVAAAGPIMAYTRIGRDIIAMGSDRRASAIAGVDVDRLLIGAFVVSGMLTALSGALLSYSLAAASPSGLSDVLVPAAAAAILGGVSLAGGTGKPLGIAAGVFILCVIRSGLNALGVTPYVHDIATGSVLLAVAVLDAPALARRVSSLGLRWRAAPAVDGSGRPSDNRLRGDSSPLLPSAGKGPTP